MIELKPLSLVPKKRINICILFRQQRKKAAKYGCLDETDKRTTENSNELKNFTPPTVPSEDEIKKANMQNKENFIQTKMEIDQSDLDTKERADRENKERLIRNIVNPAGGLAVNDQITLQDIHFPKANIVPPLQLSPIANAVVDEITNNVLKC